MNLQWHNVAGGGRRIAYREFGTLGDAGTLFCVHGMTRNGLDFAPLARQFADQGWHVICPDVAGRGDSDYLDDPAKYQLPTYAGDLLGLISALGLDRVDWLGTSMGGLIGMIVAGNPQMSAVVKRLILNDIGPFLPKQAIARIRGYVGRDWAFDTIEQAEAHVRVVHGSFGPMGDGDWRRVTEVGFRRADSGALVPNYDPGIAASLGQGPAEDIDLWSVWDAIQCPTLVLRGEVSDLLLAETAREMTVRGPRAEAVEIAKVGHAPTLLQESQIGVVRRWLSPTP